MEAIEDLPKTAFQCRKCGAPAGPEVEGGPPTPTCKCNDGFLANLYARAVGQSSLEG